MLSQHVRERDCLEFGQLRLAFLSIRVINRVPQAVRFVSELYLTGNHLMSLTGIQQFYNLEVLHFDFNLVSLPEEIEKIHNPFFLRDISFLANPIQRLLTKETLLRKGFTRLQRVNQPREHPSPNAKARPHKQDDPTTTRRNPSYRQEHEALQTHRKAVGKIYCNPRFRQKPPPFSRETRESTVKQQMEGSESLPEQQLERTVIREVKPFQYSPPGVDSDETAKFSGESAIQIGEQFLLEEKERLAEAYYQRILVEKSFAILKASDRLATLQEEVEPHLGELLNNNLETIHFSLIKLRHEFMQRSY